MADASESIEPTGSRDASREARQPSPGAGGGLEAGGNAILRRGGIVLVVLVLVLAGIVGGSRLARRLRNVEEPIRIADVSSERLLATGSVVGFAGDGETQAWLGIPYARPPIGDLRWRAPRDPAAWVDTLDALAFGRPCTQLSTPLGGVPAEDDAGFAGDEDCLTLNVWAPRAEADSDDETEALLPVMVWIHGGGNRVGQGGGAMYDGARLAGREKVVVVSFNYRLGPFGWLSMPELRAEAEDPAEASGNFGLLDQIHALRWVRKNIAEFGGDPDNVTIFGESAGAADVFALLLAPPARGLFHRAIAQSGSTDSVSRAEAENAITADPPGHRHSSAEIIVTLLEQAGVVPDRPAARRYAEALSDADLLEFLRSLPARDVLVAFRDPDRPDRIEVPTLIRDGALLPEGDWLDAMRAGRFHPVPVMLGSNRDEMKLFLSQDPQHVHKRFGVLYRVRDPADYERRARYHSDLWTARAVDRPAAALSDSGRTFVYAYRFDWDEEPRLLGTDLSRLIGASHGLELSFLFGNFDLGDPLTTRMIFSEESRAGRELLSERMMGYWAEFARSGRPGRGGRDDLPEWIAWETEPWGDPRAADDAAGLGSARAPASGSANVMLLDTEIGGGIRVARMEHSRDLVIAAVDAEADLEQDEKCAMLIDLFSGRPDWNPEEYAVMGRQGCGAPSAGGEVRGGGPEGRARWPGGAP
jgi:para-nitrobenzyl esterase